jgi:hypothetical protein
MRDRPQDWTHCVGGGPIDGRKVGLCGSQLVWSKNGISHVYELNEDREYEYVGLQPTTKRAHD